MFFYKRTQADNRLKEVPIKMFYVASAAKQAIILAVTLKWKNNHLKASHFIGWHKTLKHTQQIRQKPKGDFEQKHKLEMKET